MFSKNYRFGLDSKNMWAYMLQYIVHNNQFLSVLNNLYNLSGGVDKDVCIHTEILALSFNFSVVFILLNVNLMLLLDILYVLVMLLKKKEGNCFQYRTICSVLKYSTELFEHTDIRQPCKWKALCLIYKAALENEPVKICMSKGRLPFTWKRLLQQVHKTWINALR